MGRAWAGLRGGELERLTAGFGDGLGLVEAECHLAREPVVQLGAFDAGGARDRRDVSGADEGAELVGQGQIPRTPLSRRGGSRRVAGTRRQESGEQMHCKVIGVRRVVNRQQHFGGPANRFVRSVAPECQTRRNDRQVGHVRRGSAQVRWQL